MITKDIYGLTVNTDKCFEIQVRTVYVKKTFFGHKIKKSKEWSHWQYYKTMAAVLEALKYYKSIYCSTEWDFRPAHKYYDLLINN